MEKWIMQPMSRLVLAGGSIVAGFMIALFLVHHGSFVAVMTVFTIGLAALLGTGKLASP